MFGEILHGKVHKFSFYIGCKWPPKSPEILLYSLKLPKDAERDKATPWES